MTKPAGFITPIPVAFTQIGYNQIGSGTPVVTRKSLYSITYDEAVTSSVFVLPIYAVTPAPISLTITNTGGAAEAPRATFDGTTLTFTAPGYIKVDATFLINGARYNVTKLLASSVSTENSTVRSLVSYNAGSLSKHINDACVAAKTGNELIRRQLFSTHDVATLTFGRNLSCFLNNVGGLEAYPVANNSGAHRMNGVAISRRHFISVAHIGSQLGQTVYFLRMDGSLISRVIVDVLSLFRSGGDQTVCVFDERLPADFDLPHIFRGLYDYLPEYSVTALGSPNSDISTSNLRRVPFIAFNQAHLPAINYLSGSDNLTTAKALYHYPYGSITPEPWQRAAAGGDSGAPTFLLINNRLSVLGSQQNNNGGFCIGESDAELEETMALLCSRNGFGTESLTYTSLGSFTSYP